MAAKKRRAKKAEPAPDTPAEIAQAIEKKLGMAKGLYAQADKLIDQLRALGLRHGSVIEIGERRLKLIDGFRGKNKVFRTAVFPRWSLETQK